MSFIRGVGEATFSVGEFAHRRDVHEALWQSEWTVELVDCGAIVDRTAPGEWTVEVVDRGASGPWR